MKRIPRKLKKKLSKLTGLVPIIEISADDDNNQARYCFHCGEYMSEDDDHSPSFFLEGCDVYSKERIKEAALRLKSYLVPTKIRRRVRSRK